MKITVVITTYNRFLECQRAIKSVLSQDYIPYEIIVIEDNTSSGIFDWIKANNFDIKYIRNEKNLMLAGSRNKAINGANGDWIAFLDDDDEWYPSRLSEMLDCFNKSSMKENPMLGVVQCGNQTFDNGGKSLGIYLPQNCGHLESSIKNIGAKTPSSSFLFKKEALIGVNGFSENLISGIDHDIWMKLAVAGYYNICVKKPLVKIYQEPISSMMTNTSQRIAGTKQYIEKWRNTYIQWFGEKKGNQYTQKYYADVIAGLIAHNLLIKDFKAAWIAFKSVLSEVDISVQNMKFILVILKIVIKNILPIEVINFIKKRKA